MPCFDFFGRGDGKAPKLSGDLVLPDMLCVAPNPTWVEVKCYWAPSFTHITGRYEHGIDLRHYEHYMEISKRSTWPVVLWICEQESGANLMLNLKDATPRRSKAISNAWSTGSMFFPRDQFTELKQRLPAELRAQA